MADQTIASQHPNEVWGALIGALGTIGILVSALYYNLNESIKGHDRKLDEGQRAFSVIGEKLAALGEKIAHLQAGAVGTSGELERIDEDIKDLTERLTALKAEHDSCIPRKISMRGGNGT